MRFFKVQVEQEQTFGTSQGKEQEKRRRLTLGEFLARGKLWSFAVAWMSHWPSPLTEGTIPNWEQESNRTAELNSETGKRPIPPPLTHGSIQSHCTGHASSINHGKDIIIVNWVLTETLMEEVWVPFPPWAIVNYINNHPVFLCRKYINNSNIQRKQNMKCSSLLRFWRLLLIFPHAHTHIIFQSEIQKLTLESVVRNTLALCCGAYQPSSFHWTQALIACLGLELPKRLLREKTFLC